MSVLSKMFQKLFRFCLRFPVFLWLGQDGSLKSRSLWTVVRREAQMFASLLKADFSK